MGIRSPLRRITTTDLTNSLCHILLEGLGSQDTVL